MIAFRTRNADDSRAFSTGLSIKVLKQLTCMKSNAEIATNIVNKDEQLKSQISQLKRSKRVI
jgi:hypothetical protein